MRLDEKDLKVLEILKKSAKLTTQQISKKIQLPITTVHNRIKKLEKLGVIEGYTVKLNYKKLDKGIKAHVLVHYSPGKTKQEEVAKKIKILPGVEAVDILAGGADLLVTMRVKDIDELNETVIRKLREIEGVEKTQTMIVLSSA